MVRTYGGVKITDVEWDQMAGELDAVAVTTLSLEQFTGADCTGTDGALDRVLATSSISTANGQIIVVVDKQTLRKTDDFTTNGNDITFLIKIFNTQKIDLFYLT